MARRRQNIRDMQEKKPVAKAPSTPSYLDRALGHPQTRTQRDDAVNRLITRSTVGIAAVIIVVIAIALAYQYVWLPQQAVARVNGQAISIGDFQNRVRFERARITQLAVNTQQRAQQQAQQYASIFQQDEETLLKQILDNEPQYQTWVNEINFPDQLGQRVLADMVDDVLVSQKAKELNITVDDAKVLEAQDTYFGYDPTVVAMIGTPATATPSPTITPTPFVSPTPTVPPTATLTPTETPTATTAPTIAAEATGEATSDAASTAEATVEIVGTPTETPTIVPSPTLAATEVVATYEANVRTYRQEISNASRVSGDELDKFFREQALRNAVGESLLVDNKTLYVSARHILVATEEEAQEILAALNSGGNFAELAMANSTDTGSGAKGGELGWAPATNYVKEFKQAVIDLPIGEISQPVKTEFGYHIIQVRAREERDVAEADKASVQNALFSAWLTQVRTDNEANIERYDWTSYVPQN